MEAHKKNEIISMSLKPEVLEELDNMTKEFGLSGRSETIRQGIHSLRLEFREREKLKGKINAILTVVHPHTPKVTKTAHKYQKCVMSHLHNHFENNKCIDIFVLRGEALTVKSLVESIQKIKSVEQSKLVVVS